MEKSSRTARQDDKNRCTRISPLKRLGVQVVLAVLFMGMAHTLDIRKTLEGIKEEASRIVNMEDRTKSGAVSVENGEKIEVPEGSEKSSPTGAEKDMPADNEKEKSLHIESLVKGHELLAKQEYLSALEYYSLAQEEYLQSEKPEESVQREIGMGLCKALLGLGRFDDTIKEVIRIGVMDSEGLAILQKATQFKKLTINSPEEEVNSALMESPLSAALLKIRIAQRIRKKMYQLALFDAEVLAEIDTEEKSGEAHMMHCYFLMGKTDNGMNMLRTNEELSTLYEKAQFIVQKYNGLNRHNSRCTAYNYREWRTFTDKDLALARLIDSRFTPTIFTYTMIKALEIVVRMGIILKESPARVIAYSEQILKEKARGGAPTEKDWKDHISVMINLGKFSMAHDAIKENMKTDSAEYNAVKKLYNENIKIAREKKNQEDAIKKKKRKKRTKGLLRRLLKKKRRGLRGEYV